MTGQGVNMLHGAVFKGEMSVTSPPLNDRAREHFDTPTGNLGGSFRGGCSERPKSFNISPVIFLWIRAVLEKLSKTVEILPPPSGDVGRKEGKTTKNAILPLQNSSSWGIWSAPPVGRLWDPASHNWTVAPLLGNPPHRPEPGLPPAASKIRECPLPPGPDAAPHHRTQ